MTRIVSYNVNGIRSAINKGLIGWLTDLSPHIVCFQELKANEEDIPQKLFEAGPYRAYYHTAEKKGYSGVGILSQREPLHVERGCGIEKYDREGRVLRIDFEKFSVMNVYIPSGTTGEIRQAVKDEFMADFKIYIQELLTKIPRLLICGDFNICHKAIDIHNPVSNKDSSGFLPHEREWLTGFLGIGLKDSFRMVDQRPHQYTWWSFRANARANNKGWRIDYHMVSDKLAPDLISHIIHAEAKHSDHCPIELTLKAKI